jgi:hypothetical protein
MICFTVVTCFGSIRPFSDNLIETTALYQLVYQCGDFSRLTVAGGWPYKAKTCRSSEIKCNLSDILGNLNTSYVALEMDTSG